MTDIVLYRLTSAEPVDGPLITLDGVPVRAHSVELASRYRKDEELGPDVSVIGRADVLDAIDVTLRVLPPPDREFGIPPDPMVVATLAPARPFSAEVLPDGGYLDADGGHAVLEVWQAVPTGRVILVLDGTEITLDEREAWTFLTEVAAIIGRHEDDDRG